MAPTWEQVRGANYGTMGRSISGTVHRPDGSWQLIRHIPDAAWRYENAAGEPVFIETPTDRWSRGADGTMVHAVKSPNTIYAVMGIGSPSLLLRAYDTFPLRTTRGFDDNRFVDPTTPRHTTVRGRAGWEVSGRDQQANENVTYVFDAELGVALRWQRGEDWMELADPIVDKAFDRDLFSWSGPSRTEEDELTQHQREHEERQRALAEIPQAVPTWLPLTTHVHPTSGDPRTGELSLSVGGNAPQFTLRRWVTAIGEPKLDWPNDSTPQRHRQPLGDWTYEIRSYQEMDKADCVRIVESIVPVDPPNRNPADISAELASEEHDRQEAEVLASLGTGRTFEDARGYESLLLRTDFTDENAWRTIAVTAMAPVPQGSDMDFAANITCIDNRVYDGLTVDGVLNLMGEPPPYYIFLVDAETVRNPEMPIVTVYTGPDDPERPRGRTFRVIPTEMWSVENNLSLANMDFEDFADSTGEDGIFRGF
ncbi:hypothetical protein QMK17_21280 [Rhodococcus sp. G-MC3]|uniref:DUF6924 domain-containing protein n=1 Tax=Rhodococcus sp. G-MC3 TaxID=3046209 RepID=UPI0024BAB025|nr:hypothetical protein [Rhodococcus sp. G-MC3]MDJ0395854.1 hypothetical protein [Rhodococcus sp. G-MC3]